MKHRILIVDDEADIRFIVRTTLKPHYEVVEAVNGLDALEKIERYEPDFVIMDVQMPLMTGFEACACIRDNPKFEGLGVMFLTSLSEKDDIKHGYSVGANMYLTKPFDPDRLLKNLKIQLEQHAPRPKPKRYSLEEIQQAEKAGLVPVVPGGVEYAPAAPKDAKPAAAAGPIRFMVIEQTSDIADAIRAAMANGDEVIGMEYGRLAVSLLVKAQPDVLVLEVTEPHLMGLHLCRALRTNRAFDRVAIVACSVKAEPRNIKAADQAGADQFLPKPFAAQDFLDKVEQLKQKRSFEVMPKLLTLPELEDFKANLKAKKLEMESQH